MSGILFFKTRMLEELKRFYLDKLGCQLWLDQGDCLILKHGNLLLGFCERDSADTESLITFFYNTRDEVDRIHQALRSIAVSSPSHNDRYRIYQFFAYDPEGRKLEFQYFEHPVNRHLTGGELLLQRRSVRHFKPTEIPADVLEQVLDMCRYAPTARNSQSYYFKVIRDGEVLKRLSEIRGSSSAPIGRTPLAVAICSDPELSKRYIQDGCIAAYHLMLAAWYFGLGTCWIAAMDTEDVKSMLNVPERHYVATVTPLGYPEHPTQVAPERKDISWFLRE